VAVASRPMVTSSPAPDVAAPDAPYRLPRTAAPRRYTLCLAPDVPAATFDGTAEIELDVLEPIDRLVCNAAELAITDAAVTLADGSRHGATVTLDEVAERATFSFSEQLAPGTVVLSCSFTGVLNDLLRGFYRSTYVDEAGASHTIATTQMESTDARRAFPCWDEPDRKAVFDVTLVVDPEFNAYSNSSVVGDTIDADGRRRVRFAPTMVMSSYLVALIVGPLVATEPRDVDGVPVRIIHVPGKERLTGYALDVAEHALRFFSAYFDIAYPADKLDLVAVPDFAFGAMENLGCVTFRETALLVDPESAARAELERVADVIAHEIAHMWFGDLVTMGWWEGIWLNEAFATFMEVLCVDAFRPRWQRWVSFGLEREAALAVDGLHSTRPIEYPVGSPEEADGMFDVLTYQKGGSVLRMLEQYLGATVFRDGVRRYLRQHAYANTVTSDLWDALEAASGEPVRAVADTWILQGGHPLVTLRDGRLHQEPFAYGRSEPGADDNIGSAWQVPVIVRAAGSADETRLLLGEEPADLGELAGDGPAVVNAGGWGVYRTGYGPAQLAELGAHLGRLAPLERANLFSDTWALVLAGHVSVAEFLALGVQLGQDDEPSTFATLAGALSLCDRVVAERDRPALAAATRSLLGGRAASLGWEPQRGEGERTPSLRALLVSMLGTLGEDEATRREARARYDAAAGGGAALDPNLESAVLDVVADAGRVADYEAFLGHYRAPKTPQEEQRYLRALCDFPDADLAERTFSLALSEVRTQDAPYVILDLLAARPNGPDAWERLKASWDDVMARFPINSHSRMLSGIRVLCRDEALADDVARFVAEHPLRSGQRSVEQSLERLRINTAFGTRERDGLGAVLAAVAAGPS
jgi:puromycin-sensitive aminopeptidase